MSVLWKVVTLYGAAAHLFYVYIIFFHSSTRHLDHNTVPHPLDFKEDEWLLMNDVLRMTGASYFAVAVLNLILFYCHIPVPLKIAFAFYNIVNYGANFMVFFDHYMSRMTRWRYIRTPAVLNAVGVFLNVLALLMAVLVHTSLSTTAPTASETEDEKTKKEQ
eukprot:TRINITY_DN5737_c0_g1_i1.p1 TRINITY_DN5737_c0_g1~~TRINITY_DN5737_c0_g1_i1.p1  ORF type:complete len:162 (-),score=33.16 TRINITY_DN5737_c0_g1_i1:24-509(-)